MIKVRQKLVPISKHNIKCPNLMTAEYITVHNTANDASANSEINYMISNDNQTSYHFAIDDKEVVQGILTNRNAWHCGDGNGNGNRKSIGIEICYSKSGGERYKKAEELAIKFIAQLLKERKWGIERVKKHQDWSGKNCPHRILDEGRWKSFLKRIETELKGDEKQMQEQIKKLEQRIVALEKQLNTKNLPVSDWAVDAKKWVMETGVSDGTNPRGIVTREQSWTMMHRDSKLKQCGCCK